MCGYSIYVMDQYWAMNFFSAEAKCAGGLNHSDSHRSKRQIIPK